MAIGDRPKAAGKPDEEESAPAVLLPDAPGAPSPEEEAAFLAVEGTDGEAYSLPSKAESAEPEAGDASLPPMEDLVKRIPAPVRETLEELFRARFVTVKRFPQSALK